MTRTTYGEVGLLEMPSARMAPDGQFAFTFGALKNSQRYTLSFQILPWLEGNFRYSRIHNLDAAGFDRFDRSFSVKARLLREGEYLPDVSLGIRDLIGTGVYSGEYIVASKHLGDFDTSLGLGWGRFGQQGAFANPLGLIFPSFKTRNTDTTSTIGGQIAFSNLFHGKEVGVFGGVVWHTPLEHLNLLLEYSSDGYEQERRFGSLAINNQFNFGASYRLFNSITLAAGWLYGTTAALSVTIDADPTAALTVQRIGPEIPPPAIRTPEQQSAALSRLLEGGRLMRAGEPFVLLAADTPSETLSDTLASALMAQGPGVTDVEVAGDTVMVLAHLSGPVGERCDHYATSVGLLAPRLENVALSDLDDPRGGVAICRIRHAGLQYAYAPAQDANALADSPPDNGIPRVAQTTVVDRIRSDIEQQGIRIEAISVQSSSVWLYIDNGRYLADTVAVGRIARILMANTAPDIELFHIVTVHSGMLMQDFRLTRSALERAVVTSGTAAELGDAIAILRPPMQNPTLNAAESDNYPHLTWRIGPSLVEGFFDPRAPLEIEILAALDASLWLTPHLDIEGRFEANILDNFLKSPGPSNSVLPHVRSDVALYFRDGKNGIESLKAVYRGRLSSDVYFEAKAGYLESMFAGAGVQVIWRPEGSRFAFGADAYQVWQRNFDRLVGLQDYNVFTAHVSAYYQSPWYGLNFAAHAGRYLAGDYGATFEVTRRFETGVEIGAYATFTNVPFAKFGEGSFDKGILIHIPLEWALPTYTQASYDLKLQSLTRDGGQRLAGDDSLFGETRGANYSEIADRIDDIVAP